MRYTRELLAEVAAQSTSINDMLRRLGVPLAGGTHTHISGRLKKFGIDTSHFAHLHMQKPERRTYTKQALEEAAKHCTNPGDVLRYLGIEPRDGMYSYVRKRLAHYDIDTSHFRTPKRGPRKTCPEFIEPTALAEAAAHATGIAGIIRALALPGTHGARRLIKDGLEVYQIDTSHFLGQAHQKGNRSPRRLTAAELLHQLPPGSRRTPHFRLRRALDERGVARVCSGCGMGESWNGKRLGLEIDHIDGDWLNNKQGNLRYLCPNCHSQTSTFRGRNRRLVQDVTDSLSWRGGGT